MNLINLINAIPELLPGLLVPGVQASQVAAWVLAGLLLLWLAGLFARSY